MYYCLECEYRFYSLEGMMIHLVNSHEETLEVELENVLYKKGKE